MGSGPLQFMLSAGAPPFRGRVTSAAAPRPARLIHLVRFGTHPERRRRVGKPASARSHASPLAVHRGYAFPAPPPPSRGLARPGIRSRRCSTTCRRCLLRVAPRGAASGGRRVSRRVGRRSAASFTSPNSVTSLIWRGEFEGVGASDGVASSGSSGEPKRATRGVSSVRFAWRSRQLGSQSTRCS